MCVYITERGEQPNPTGRTKELLGYIEIVNNIKLKLGCHSGSQTEEFHPLVASSSGTQSSLLTLTGE